MDGKTKSFLRIEFVALGDMTHDGLMEHAEYERLMKLLGYLGEDAEVQNLWEKAEKHGDKMDREQYVKFMSDPVTYSKTEKWRKVFAQIDQDASGYATPEELKTGMASLGLDVKEGLFNKMDLNQDGKVDYSEFLKKQLHQKK